MSLPGNSFLCAVLLWLVHGGTLVNSFRIGTDIPHWVILCRDGKVRHFAPVKDFFSSDFCHILYLGRFETLE